MDWIKRLLVIVAVSQLTLSASSLAAPYSSDPNGDGTHEVTLPWKGVRIQQFFNNGAPPSRTYTEGVSKLKIKTFTPITVGVYTKIGNIAGNLDVSTRHITETAFDFTVENLKDDQNIFDERGRGVLMPGNLVCRVTHRVILADYQRAGLVLGMQFMDVTPIPGLVQASAGAGGSSEELKSGYFEESKRCPIGPIPAYTSVNRITELCQQCLVRVLPVLQEDVESRLNSLRYVVQTPLCQEDSECESEETAFTAGRCILVKDKNDSYYSECRPRSKIGGICPGEDSNGMFQYPCDRGLKCVQVHRGSGFANVSLMYDYSKYECRDPKRPYRTKP